MNPALVKAPQCTICRHPKRELVDVKLAAGVTYRQVAEEYGLSVGATYRHKKHGERAIADAAIATARQLVLPRKRFHRSELLQTQLDAIANEEKGPLLARALASVRDAAELRSALQLLLVECAQTYARAKTKNLVSAQIAALKQATTTAVVLGRAHGWITQEVITDARTVNIIGGLERDDMLSLRDMLRDVVTYDGDVSSGTQDDVSGTQERYVPEDTSGTQEGFD